MPIPPCAEEQMLCQWLRGYVKYSLHYKSVIICQIAVMESWTGHCSTVALWDMCFLPNLAPNVFKIHKWGLKVMSTE